MIRITHILCPVDFSEISRHAFDHAAAIARWYDARLTVLSVFLSLPTMDLPPVVLQDADRQRIEADLRRFTAAVPPEVSLDLRVAQASYAHEEILAQIGGLHADLLVLGTHGRSGFERLFLGSVTEKVIRKAPCPTLVVPPRAPDVAADAPVRFQRMLCPVDFSESSLDALAYAIDMAEEADARLTVMNVIEMPPELREHYPEVPDVDIEQVHAAARAAALQRLRGLVPASAQTYCTVEIVVQEGADYRQILKTAAEQASDLIVMGVRGRSAVDRILFGSTTHHVIRTASCPVLVVRRV